MSAEEVARELRGLEIAPGLWEVRSEILDARGENLPRAAQARIKAHGRTIRSCVTPAQAARPEANFLSIQRAGRCTFRDFSLRAGRLRGSMRCADEAGPGATTAEMDGSYRPRDYRLSMRIASTGQGEGANMVIETRTTGRRIGDCPPAPARPEEGAAT